MAGFMSFATGALKQANANFAAEDKIKREKELYYTKVVTETQSEIAKQAAKNEATAKRLKDEVGRIRVAYGLPDDDIATVILTQSLDKEYNVDPKLLQENIYNYKQNNMKVTPKLVNQPGQPLGNEQQGPANPFMTNAQPAQTTPPPNQEALNIVPEQYRKKVFGADQGAGFAQQYNKAFQKPQLPTPERQYNVEVGPSLEQQKFEETKKTNAANIEQQRLQNERSNRALEIQEKQLAETIRARGQVDRSAKISYENTLTGLVSEQVLTPEQAGKRWMGMFPSDPVPDFSASGSSKLDTALYTDLFKNTEKVDPAKRQEFINNLEMWRSTKDRRYLAEAAKIMPPSKEYQVKKDEQLVSDWVQAYDLSPSEAREVLKLGGPATAKVEPGTNNVTYINNIDIVKAMRKGGSVGPDGKIIPAQTGGNLPQTGSNPQPPAVRVKAMESLNLLKEDYSALSDTEKSIRDNPYAVGLIGNLSANVAGPVQSLEGVVPFFPEGTVSSLLGKASPEQIADARTRIQGMIGALGKRITGNASGDYSKTDVERAERIIAGLSAKDSVQVVLQNYATLKDIVTNTVMQKVYVVAPPRPLKTDEAQQERLLELSGLGLPKELVYELLRKEKKLNE